MASPPTNLTVELAGTNNINVSWTATATGPAIIKIWLYYQAQGDRGAVYLDATSTEYIITNCTIGQQYNITMVALSENLPSTLVGPKNIIIGEICMIILVPFCKLCIGILVLQMVHVLRIIVNNQPCETPVPYLHLYFFHLSSFTVVPLLFLLFPLSPSYPVFLFTSLHFFPSLSLYSSPLSPFPFPSFHSCN